MRTAAWTAAGWAVAATALAAPAASPVVAWPPPSGDVPHSACSSALVGSHATYDVGPGRKYAELTNVPWLSLKAGDVVNIFYRPTPYRTKFGLRAQGTPAEPVVINGVTDANCNRPEISGQDAVTAADAAHTSFFSKQYSEFLGVVFIYQAPGDPWGYKPKHITIQNLKITGARKGNQYTAQDGSTGTYNLGAAGIYAIRVEGLTVDNDEITGNGNGVFVNSRADDDYSAYVTIRRSLLHDNGNPGSWTEHNLYIQAKRALYEGNHIGQLVPGALGSSMKDRSSGTVVRYNRIDAAARAMDLVEIEGGVKAVLEDPLYDDAWVYGNLIVSDWDRPAQSSSLLIHWGGDNDPKYFRKGTLHFYNNTVVTKATSAQVYYLSIFDMPSNTQRVVAQGNVFFHTGTSLMNLAYEHGTIVLEGSNWISSGWRKGWKPQTLLERRDADVLEGRDPGLQADFVPAAGSPLLDRGQVRLQPRAGVSPEGLALTRQFSPPAGTVPRSRSGGSDDLGAFERP